MMSFSILIILLLSNAFTTHSEDDKNSNEGETSEHEEATVFEATSEWKKLPKDQAIPRGLHVRLNLQTGEREAKLYDPEEERSPSERGQMAITTVSEDREPPERGREEGSGSTSRERLKKILQKIEANEGALTEEDKKVKSKFRTYEELKKELKKLEAEVKTDAEIIAELLDRYTTMMKKRKEGEKGGGGEREDEEEEELGILADLEYLVHQYDNAREFIKTGLTLVVYPSMNSSSTRCRAEAVRLMGSAVQSNPGAQVAALESGAIEALLRALSLDSSPEVRSGALYALSCLVRRFPAAQTQFLEKGGLVILSKLFESDASHLLKLQVKAITFINDLVRERLDAARGESEESGERLRQLEAAGLERRLGESEWCSLVVQTLERDMKGEVMDHDRIEKLIGAIGSLSPEACKDEFRTDLALVELLMRLELIYAQLAASEKGTEPSYFTGLYHTITNLTEEINRFDVEIVKDEL